MTTPLSSLAEKARAATRGKWRNGTDPCHFDAPEVTDDKTFAYYVPDAKNAAFIAAASPDVVLELLNQAEELDFIRKRLQLLYVKMRGDHDARWLDEVRSSGMSRSQNSSAGGSDENAWPQTRTSQRRHGQRSLRVGIAGTTATSPPSESASAKPRP
jgi:hypothetical protein